MTSVNSDNKARLLNFETFRHNVPIGIYGSFFGQRKDDLIKLRDHLKQHGFNARISEDLDHRDPAESEVRNNTIDRELSEKLINDSKIHIFVLPLRREDEPSTLIQSVSMEMEKLITLIEYGHKSNQHCIILIETGLMGNDIHGMGALARGLVVDDNGWECADYVIIDDIFQLVRHFCTEHARDLCGF